MTHSERAFQIWQVLIGLAHNRQTFTYEKLGDSIGMGAGTLAQPLGYIMRYCDRNNLPPLTVLVVNKVTGILGTGLTTLEDLNRDREKVYKYKWYKRRPIQIADLELNRI